MKRKQGVSLIVLSITILVMAILAATAIIALEDSGIIGRSKNTVKLQSYNQEYTRLNVIKNGILTDNLGIITLEQYIIELKNRGIIEENVIENADGSRTVKTITGFEVIIAQSGESDLNISIDGYNQSNNNSGENNGSNDDDGNVENNTTPEPPPANAMTFTIDETTYYAEEGMTWGEWVDSRYNTIGAYYGDEEYGDNTFSINVGEKVYISEAWGERPYIYISNNKNYVSGDIRTSTLIEKDATYYAYDSREEWTSSDFLSFFIVDGHYIAFKPLSPNYYKSEPYGTISWIEHLAEGYVWPLIPVPDMEFMPANSDLEPSWGSDTETWLTSILWQPYNWYGYEYALDITEPEETVKEMKIKLQELKDEDFIVGVYDLDTGDIYPYYLCYSDGTRVKYGDDIMEFHLGEYTLIAK